MEPAAYDIFHILRSNGIGSSVCVIFEWAIWWKALVTEIQGVLKHIHKRSNEYMYHNVLNTKKVSVITVGMRTLAIIFRSKKLTSLLSSPQWVHQRCAEGSSGDGAKQRQVPGGLEHPVVRLDLLHHHWPNDLRYRSGLLIVPGQLKHQRITFLI